uniref:Uncharacterized protein n=1 Tax=Lactuca sativa TaxID=4236 RepID=A0A9R1VSD1_LACSA|nr:hypothetical protein LSAT_V11C400204520 [Lactuca sativa]
MSDYSGFLQSLKRNTNSHLNLLVKKYELGYWRCQLTCNEKQGSKSNADSFQPDKKRSRDISSKNKRLLIESEDALELKYTWEELQDMLTPLNALNPSSVTIEDQEFEEYENSGPNVITVQNGDAKWTCQENVWDHNRSACVAPDELRPRELDHLLRVAKEFHKWRNSMNQKPAPDQD